MPAARSVTLFSWLVLAGVLLGLWRCTTLGAIRTPTLLRCERPVCAPVVELALRPPPAAPFHRCVSAELDGVPGIFLLDTGAADTVLDQGVQARRGLLTGTRRVIGAVNQDFGLQPLRRVGVLALGENRYAGFDAAAVDLSAVSAAVGIEITGILGLNVVGSTAFELDYAANVLRLDAESGGPVAEALAHAEDGFDVAEVGGGLFVQVQLGTVAGRFLLDSGAAPTQIEAGLARAAGARAAGRRESLSFSATGLGPADLESVVLPQMALGGVSRTGLHADVGEANLLGGDFLAGAVLRVDPAAGRAQLGLAVSSTAR